MKSGRLIAFVSILLGTAPWLDASALGVGDATVKSRLNAPLEVEIALIGANFDDAGLRAAIGTKAMHDAAGIATASLLRRLRAEVSAGSGRGGYVRVYTEQSVREPVVSFVLVVENAREHVTREYTLLLDPPGYSLPSIAIRERIPNPTPEPAPRPLAGPIPGRAPATKADAPVSLAPRREHFAERIGPVSRGDTLSKLAMRLQKDRALTWAQMTWALYRANPHAFIDGDINKLKSDVYLNIPAATTASQWSHREAMALIKGNASHTSRAGASNLEPIPARLSTPVVAVAPADEPNTAPAPRDEVSPATTPAPVADAAVEPPDPVFRLLSPEDVGDVRADGSVGVPMTTAHSVRIQQLMAQTNLQIEESHEEIALAREQLIQTERQIATLVEVVARKDSEIKGLENRLADLREFINQQSVAMTRPEPNWLQRLLLEALLLAAMVGLLAVTLLRWNDARRRQWPGAEMANMELELPAPASSPTPLPSAVVDDEPETRSADAEPQVETSGNDEPRIDYTEVDEIEVKGDPLMEANAYFAYGYHEKAKDVLVEFIRENPADAESRLVMLRVLHAIREKRKFKRHAEALLELVDDESDDRWTEAARLGRALFPDERLFNASAYKRADDDKWEETVWTGTRPAVEDVDEHVYLDIDEFKYVDLFLLDETENEEGNDEPNPSSSSSTDAADTEAELAKWRADMVRKGEHRGVNYNLGEVTEDSLDDDQP